MTKLERRVRDYVKAHKKALAITSLAFVLVAVQHKGIKNLNEFLEANDLYQDYYGFPPLDKEV